MAITQPIRAGTKLYENRSLTLIPQGLYHCTKHSTLTHSLMSLRLTREFTEKKNGQGNHKEGSWRTLRRTLGWNGNAAHECNQQGEWAGKLVPKGQDPNHGSVNGLLHLKLGQASNATFHHLGLALGILNKLRIWGILIATTPWLEQTCTHKTHN